MAKLEIDLVDTKTEDENHQRLDTKPGILYDGTIVQSNAPKAMNNEDENEHFDVEGDVIKTELKVEREDDSESETVECKRVSAVYEVLNVHKTAMRVEIKFENDKQENLNKENCFLLFCWGKFSTLWFQTKHTTV